MHLGTKVIRVIASMLLGALMLSGEVRAENNWDSVKTLMHGSEVTILQYDGRRLNGRLEYADDTKIVIITRRPFCLALRPLCEQSMTMLRSGIEQIDWVIKRRRSLGFVELKDDRVMVYRSVHR
jgi:hypothetical protein